ncbi:MAG: outer membrane protein assembly factor BamD, partial [bacterium]
LERYKASIIALNNSLQEYPNTKYREEIMYLILKSNFLLAKNSIQSKKKERFQNAIDAYYSFAEEYPSSKYLNEAESIYQRSNKYLSINNN